MNEDLKLKVQQLIAEHGLENVLLAIQSINTDGTDGTGDPLPPDPTHPKP